MIGLDAVTLAEMRRGARRWTTFALRMLFLALVALMILWFQSNESPGSTSEYANLGRRLFQAFVPLHLAFVALSAVLGACDAVSREARTGTLGLLAVTGLGGRAIARGKWAAVMFQTGMWVAAGAPVLAVSAFLGGVGVLQVLGALLLPLSTAGLLAALALWASARLEQGWSALLLTGFFAAVYSFLFLLLMVTVPTRNVRSGSVEEWGMLLACSLHPLAALAILIYGGPVGDVSWLGSLLLSWAAVRRLLAQAGVLIEARAVRDPRAVESPRPSETVAPELATSWLGLFAGAGDVWDHDPLLWKERRMRAGVFLSPFVRFMLVWILLLVLPVAAVLGRRQRIDFALLCCAALLPGVISSAASLFAAEREGRRWELLLSAPVTAVQVVRAKILGGFFPFDLLLVLLPALAVVAATMGGPAALDLGMAVLIGGSFLFTVFAGGAALSLIAPTVRGAALLTAGFAAFLLFGGPLLLEAMGVAAWSRTNAARLPWAFETAINPYRLLRLLRKADTAVELNAALGLARTFLGVHAVVQGSLVAWMLARFNVLARRF
jgi:ABC-type transport system involved in multi-copper enzyme maturation permease subunit